MLPEPEGPDDKAPRNKPRMRKLRFAVVILGLSVLAFVSWIFGIMMAVAQDLPSLENRQQYSRSQNSVVYDVNGVKLATLTNNQGRILDDTDEIAPVMKEATVAIEDQRFYEHRGVDFQGIARAVVDDLTSGSAQQGASTITQQFVKNALAAQQDRTVFQKLREAALAYHLERQWDKDKILTEYLNEIYFGEGATGIEAAARTYFGYNHSGCGTGEDAATSCASELYPWEAALLAGIISSPSAYSPRNFPDNATARRNQVLGNMVDQGYISQSDYDTYSQYPIPLPSQIHPPAENSQAPYFTSWLRQQLVDRYGAGEAFGGGLQIISSLDLELQRQAESVVSSTLSGLGPTASLVVLDNSTGAVRAMVGGPSYQDAPFNLATNGHRQPGSSFKPFTLITALEQGHSSGEVYHLGRAGDPVQGEGPEEQRQRHQGRQRRLSRQQLQRLVPRLGLDRDRDHLLRQLGLRAARHPGRAPERRRYRQGDGGRHRPLHADAVLDQRRAVRAVQPGDHPRRAADRRHVTRDGARLQHPRGGRAQALGHHGLERGRPGRDRQGHRRRRLQPGRPGAGRDRRERREQARRQAGDRSRPVADETRSILATVVSSGTGRRAQNGEPTWGKTGTTDDNGDAWFCGATPKFTMCVWVGYPDTVQPMETEFGGAPVDGGTFPALIFSRVATAYESIMAARKANYRHLRGRRPQAGPTIAGAIRRHDPAPGHRRPRRADRHAAAPARIPRGPGEPGTPRHRAAGRWRRRWRRWRRRWRQRPQRAAGGVSPG